MSLYIFNEIRIGFWKMYMNKMIYWERSKMNSIRGSIWNCKASQDWRFQRIEWWYTTLNISNNIYEICNDNWMRNIKRIWYAQCKINHYLVRKIFETEKFVTSVINFETDINILIFCQCSLNLILSLIFLSLKKRWI